MLTKVQKKRLAREARKLAMECVDGTAPDFGVGTYAVCAAGCVFGRARLLVTDTALDDAEEAVWIANDTAASVADRHAAIVFPLLAWGDCLEESSEQPRAAPSKDF